VAIFPDPQNQQFGQGFTGSFAPSLSQPQGYGQQPVTGTSFGYPQQGFGGQIQQQSPLQQQAINQFQQIVSQLEQAEARHAQMLQQIQAEEQRATEQLQQLKQLGYQLAQQAQQAQQVYGAHLVQQPATSFFPRV